MSGQAMTREGQAGWAVEIECECKTKPVREAGSEGQVTEGPHPFQQVPHATSVT